MNLKRWLFITSWLTAGAAISFLIIFLNALISPTHATRVMVNVFGEAWWEAILFSFIGVSAIISPAISMKLYWEADEP